MRGVILLIVVLSFNKGVAQKDYINADGTISNYTKRELLLATINDLNLEDVSFDIEDDYFIVVTKEDCGEREFEDKEMQKLAMQSSFKQVLGHVNNFKNVGYNLYYDCQLEGMIFKTNVLCMSRTRRYHFKFSLNELNSFPDYMDIEELIKYVVLENQNKNIVMVKNP